MNYESMKKDAQSRSKFVKLDSNVPTKVKFLSDDFEKIESQFKNKNGEPIIKYQVPCLIDGHEKFYQASQSFYEKCMQKAHNRQKKFTEITYIITKTGEGLKTEYDIDVADGSIDPSVPF